MCGWKTDFGVTERIIDVLLSNVSKRPFAAQVAHAVPMATSREGMLNKLGNKYGAIASWEESDLEASPLMGASVQDKEKGKGGVELHKQTDSFVRQSTKYWVKPCDLAAVCTVLAENLTVHTFDGGSPWTPISSVYIDNMKRECYEARITKETGARIIRLRTYNNDARKVYVERKIHYEAWTGIYPNSFKHSLHTN